MEVKIYTADDEDPKCNRCEHVNDDYFCVKKWDLSMARMVMHAWR